MSDTTVPATDDFGSRFLEFDEYSEGQSEEEPVSVSPQINPPPNAPNLPGNARSLSNHKPDISKPNSLSRRRTSSQRGRKRSSVALENKSEATDDEDDDSMKDEELSTFQNPKLLTARQMSLKSQRSSSSGKKSLFTRTHSGSTLLSLESLETPKSAAVLTPEQVAAHQRRVAHRRETAKHKAESEKRQIVERLLKINANSIGRRGRRRGRNVRAPHLRITNPSLSSTSLADTNDSTNLINEGSPDSTETATDQKSKSSTDPSGPILASDTVDEFVKIAPNKSDPSELSSQANKYGIALHTPEPNSRYIRIISSSRLEPSKLVCFPQITDTELKTNTNLWSSKPVPSIPQPRLCDLGCGRLRRYACAKTGRSLCSLACYKQNLSLII